MPTFDEKNQAYEQAREKKDSTTGHFFSGSPSSPEGSATPGKTEKQRKELWLYLAVSIAAVECLIFVAALFYSFVRGAAKGTPELHLSFPWLSWAASAVIVPSIILVAVHLAVGLFKKSTPENDEDWQKHLPEKLQKAYRILSRAPALVLFIGIIVLGSALLTLDGALQAVEGLLTAFKPYLLHIVIGALIVLAIFGLAAIWLNFKTRKLYAEYEYRRAVLEKTGLIIVDKKSYVLQPGQEEASLALEAGADGTFVAKALPAGENGTPPTEAEETLYTDAHTSTTPDMADDETANVAAPNEAVVIDVPGHSKK